MSLPPTEVANTPRVSIAVWSDVVCPWCYIGERRLRQALAARPDVEVELHWRPFQLQPRMPPSGVAWQEFAPRKFGGQAGMDAAFAQVTQVGAGDGIAFRFDRVATAPNTVDAHRLILLAEERGRVADAVEAFFAGYFSEGANLNDLETLVRLVARAGIGEADARAVLEEDDFWTDVLESQREADQLGLRGVPFYTFRAPDGHQWGINGAAEAEVFVQTLDTAVRHALRHSPKERASPPSATA